MNTILLNLKKLLVLTLTTTLIAQDWTQIGADIDGEAAGDWSGYSVSLNANGSVVAIGAHYNDGIGTDAGHVRIYENQNGTWTQIGADIDGEAEYNYSGISLSLNSDGSIVAIGASGNDLKKGHVRIYKNQNGTWTQIGADIDGEAEGDRSGYSVSLSSDGSIVAIGAYENDGTGINAGHVRIYENINGTWTQIGTDIDGEAAGDYFGTSVSLNSDGSVVAIGAYNNDGTGTNAGHVRVYKNQSGTWTQVGADIDGEAEGDKSGTSVSLNSDGSVVAIGANYNDGNGTNSGHVRVYQNISGTWTQVGADIDGEAADDYSGRSVRLSADGSIVAIGAHWNDGAGIVDAGHIRIYINQSGTWTQLGADINGEASEDRFGNSVSLSDNGSVVAIGGYQNDENGSNSGHVKVFRLEGLTYVPDDNFEQALIDLGYDSGTLDNYVPTANISGVTSLDVYEKEISDLTGIEDFTALTLLRCYSNQLTSLDISENIHLDKLYCSDNLLTSLDISKNTALTILFCNTNQLTSLDLSTNTDLDVLYCQNNQLTSLDISTNTVLTWLNCYSNQLTSLDVSSNPSLISFGCGSNQLTSLDVSNNTTLESLDCSSNQLTTLDVSTNTNLNILYCSENLLLSLDVRNGNNSNITNFDASGNSNLTCIYVDDKTATYLSGWTKDATADFVNDESECISYTYVPDDNFEQALIDLGYDSGELDDFVPTINIDTITVLDVNSKNISDLTGIKDFTALTELICSVNQLTNLDVSSNTALTTLYCNSNQLISLDISANTALKDLLCYDNQLTSLDVSLNTDLEQLHCQNNQLLSLEVTTNTALKKLACNDNQLSSLDLTANIVLDFLNCNYNQLTSLDIRNENNANVVSFNASNNADLSCIYVDDKNASYLSGWIKDETAEFLYTEAECGGEPLTYVPDDNFEQALIDLGYDSGTLDDYVPTDNISGVTSLNVNSKNISDLTGIEDFAALTHLYCVDNQIPSLDVSANIALVDLRCQDNLLTSLDVSVNTSLTDLYCNYNQLTSLEIYTNTALTNLHCYQNQLTSLDVSANTALKTLTCSDNQLTSLNVSLNTALQTLYCSNNQLTSLDLSENSALFALSCTYNQFSSIDVRTGNNENMGYFDAQDNPNLECIYVDNKNASYLSNWGKDEIASFLYTEAECGGEPLTYVPDDNFEQALIDLGYDSGDLDDFVPTASIDTITVLDVRNKNINDLTGIEDFVSLTHLTCIYNNLTSLNVSANTALTNLYCGVNNLLSIDISSNTNVVDFRCGGNQISNLDVSANTALTLLECQNNQLTSLDVSANTVLEELYCDLNSLTSLDISSNTNLINLDCSSNQLTNLDISENINLATVYCNDNQITSLDVSANTALTALWCYNNQLSSLDVSSNTALTELKCFGNQLTSLDVAANSDLAVLGCSNNQLTSLDVSANTDLTVLGCINNQLTSLDVRNGNNANVTSFDASGNTGLTCIYVDDKDATYLSGWTKDATSHFVNNETECSAITSVEDLIAEESFSIYPNPVGEFLNISSEIETIDRIIFFDITGKIIFDKEYSSTTEQINVSALDAGVYFIQIESGENIITKKLIKK